MKAPSPPTGKPNQSSCLQWVGQDSILRADFQSALRLVAHALLRAVSALVPTLALLCPAQDLNSPRTQFESRCAGCHGADGAGGEHAPSIVDTGRRGGESARRPSLRDTIQNGIPEGGMPAFSLTDNELNAIVAYVNSLRAPASEHPTPGDVSAGQAFFMGKGNCSSCHMIQGEGGILGPDLTSIGRERRLAQLTQALHNPDALHTPGYRVVSVRLRDGRTLRGLAKNESNYDLQLLDLTGHLHLLSKDQIVAETREAKSLMPPVNASEQELSDLLAVLTRLTGESPATASSIPPAGHRNEDTAFA